MSLGKQADITLFLMQFKVIAQGCFRMIPRPKNMKAIAHFGLSIDDVKSTIFRLTYRKYISGPDKDVRDKSYNVWTFGDEVVGYEFYIKLSDDFRGSVAKCLSFHEAESKCYYPYGKN